MDTLGVEHLEVGTLHLHILLAHLMVVSSHLHMADVDQGLHQDHATRLAAGVWTVYLEAQLVVVLVVANHLAHQGDAILMVEALSTQSEDLSTHLEDQQGLLEPDSPQSCSYASSDHAFDCGGFCYAWNARSSLWSFDDYGCDFYSPPSGSCSGAFKTALFVLPASSIYL